MNKKECAEVLENSEKRRININMVQICTSSNIDMDGEITNIMDCVEQES